MFFEIPTDTVTDVKFDLIDLERVPVGDPFTMVVTMHVSKLLTFAISKRHALLNFSPDSEHVKRAAHN